MNVIERYPDGSWWPNEHAVSERFPVLGRGNTGEVYPNVVYPLTGSIVNVPFALGQRDASRTMGVAARSQLEQFDGRRLSLTPMHAGYLYMNLSVIRTVIARVPGLNQELIDHQLFGSTDAPPYRRGPGDRNVVAAITSTTYMIRSLLRPNHGRLDEDRRAIAAHLDALPDIATATDADLFAIARTSAPFLQRMMCNLLLNGFCAISRSILERLAGDAGTVNELTAGLGTIESAMPANDLWALGRLVRSDTTLTTLFGEGLDGLWDRLEASHDPTVGEFRAAFADFQGRHGARGPDEWELASATWGSDPGIGLAAIDRLRLAPDERSPSMVGDQLATNRRRLAADIRADLARAKRRPFDLALRATEVYQAGREATKAEFVRLLYPIRQAMAELARRSDFDHHDFFLLTIDEAEQAMENPVDFVDVVEERRARRDYLQARVPPFWFEGEIPAPSTWPLRSDAQQIDDSARVIHGIGVCSGSATGTARVVTDPSAPGELGPDDILIAPITDPAWTPLFLAVAGVVVDVGAQQSHAAIVSRELGIPAVVSATGASTSIRDGTTVTVDGSTGLVTVHPR